MCGRYFLNGFTANELQKFATSMDNDCKLSLADYTGDIVPSAKAPVLMQNEEELSLRLLTWGVINPYNNSLIINARAETVYEKRRFKECLTSRRCVIPVNGFYEWDTSKNKFTFQNNDKSTMYLAGLYDEEGRFVILTTDANESMIKIHNRMPVVLPEELIMPWLIDNKETQNILNQVPPLLEGKAEIEQMRLEFF